MAKRTDEQKARKAECDRKRRKLNQDPIKPVIYVVRVWGSVVKIGQAIRLNNRLRNLKTSIDPREFEVVHLVYFNTSDRLNEAEAQVRRYMARIGCPAIPRPETGIPSEMHDTKDRLNWKSLLVSHMAKLKGSVKF
jgi:hypothetical protein